MISPDRVLLRYHVEAVWGVQLPPIVQNDIDLLEESKRALLRFAEGGYKSFRPTWKLCAAKLTEGYVHVWRPDVGIT